MIEFIKLCNLVTRIKVMYIFVEISFDCSHLLKCMESAFSSNQKIAVMGTVQFTSVLHALLSILEEKKSPLNITMPQARPLSMGETLGCTALLLHDCDILVFVADGRFHLEAAMIRNPSVKAFRYDPYSKGAVFIINFRLLLLYLNYFSDFC
jgi:2-(3-amino-3-carboxypropyl)histidine synthase